MNEKEVQLKVMALQAASGNLEAAKPIFAWLAESTIESEVERRINLYLGTKVAGDSAP